MDAYREACRKGARWLLDRMNSDGSVGPVEERLYYYRVPWALALVGEIGAAAGKLDWIRRNMITAAGSFEGVSPQGLFTERYGSYPLACLITGAVMLQRWDIVYPCVRQLLAWQDPNTGGMYDNRRVPPSQAEQELFPACQAGMTFLITGDLAAAERAGAWVEQLWKLQPDAGRVLYHVFRPDTGLVADVPEGDEALYITRKDKPWQLHYNGGIAAAFLGQLYLAVKNDRWLDLARAYEKFSMTTDECQFQSMQICKSGWGSGLLYTITREREYLDWTGRLGDWFVDTQLNDGHWENTKYWTPNPTEGDNIEMTAEFVMHVANIVSYLSLP